jgi:hypothetical protein
LKEDPDVVTAARKGDTQTVTTLLAAGCDIESCSSWTHGTMIYDNDTVIILSVFSLL